MVSWVRLMVGCDVGSGEEFGEGDLCGGDYKGEGGDCEG